jgi:pyruvate,water dikinase
VVVWYAVVGCRIPHKQGEVILNRVKSKTVRSGLVSLDKLLRGLRLGDNVVWRTDRLEDYSYFAEPFVEQAIGDGFDCVYLRFAPHSPVLKPRAGLTIVEVDPSRGFDYFAGEVHRIIEERGSGVCYVFDSLSALVNEWATDELLANFYQVTCPYICELGDIAYFSLMRGQHGNSTVARIRDTTQILIDVYHVSGNTYIHPLKVWDRYSPQMFLPHLISGTDWSPVFRSGDAAALSTTASKHRTSVLSDSIAPWDSVYRRLVQYKETTIELPDSAYDIATLKKELTRMLIGNHDKLNKMADRYLTLDDLLRVRDKLIGSGRIGGKSAGMLLARRILAEDKGETDFSQVLEEHDSFYIGSDVFFTFLVNNDLFQLRLQLSKNPEFSRDEFAKVERAFLAGQFPDEIVEQFRLMLDYYGQAPIIVRSSSLLEDSFTNAFAGKYRSEFCANQGSPEDRLEAFLRAVKLVYASALNPDALSYRRKQGLTEGDEQMAILIQRVSGMPYNNYFFPSLAGVAFSRNLYAWSDKIDPEKGLIRLVFGLGTRAVNRVAGDYPRMIAVSHPELRPELGTQVARYSQRNVDLLDLKANKFTTQPLARVLANNDYPNLSLLVSFMADGYLTDALPLGKPEGNLVLTFNNLLRQTGLVKIVGEMLTKLEKAWSQPIDIEFTAYIDRGGIVKVNLLQCRALRLPKASSGDIRIPDNLPKDKVLFRSNRAISAGVVENIGYILYIDPRKYAETAGADVKKSLGRVIGKLSESLRGKGGRVMMMGPGRWGSNNVDLGVNVTYSEIDNTAVLVEIAREEYGHEPELSYGTHFFQDLVEAEMVYLSVYPDDASSGFNAKFFEESPNVLADLLPEFSSLSSVLKVIDVPSVAKGAYAKVVADPQSRSALCFLDKTKGKGKLSQKEEERK